MVSSGRLFLLFTRILMKKVRRWVRLYTKLRFARAPPASFSSSLMDCQRASFRFSFNGKKGWYLFFFNKMTYSYGGSLDVQLTALR